MNIWATQLTQLIVEGQIELYTITSNLNKE